MDVLYIICEVVYMRVCVKRRRRKKKKKKKKKKRKDEESGRHLIVSRQCR